MSELAAIAEQIAEKDELERLRRENAELRRKLVELERRLGAYGLPPCYLPVGLYQAGVDHERAMTRMGISVSCLLG